MNIATTNKDSSTNRNPLSLGVHLMSSDGVTISREVFINSALDCNAWVVKYNAANVSEDQKTELYSNMHSGTTVQAGYWYVDAGISGATVTKEDIEAWNDEQEDPIVINDIDTLEEVIQTMNDADQYIVLDNIVT